MKAFGVHQRELEHIAALALALCRPVVHVGSRVGGDFRDEVGDRSAVQPGKRVKFEDVDAPLAALALGVEHQRQSAD